jgi:hypothetical protein
MVSHAKKVFGQPIVADEFSDQEVSDLFESSLLSKLDRPDQKIFGRPD